MIGRRNLLLSRQEIDVVVVDRRAERRALGLEVRDQIVQRRRIEQRARQLMARRPRGAFSITAIDSGSPPFSFCSCASRSAADSPAGPPPTISTSTSSVSRFIVKPRDLSLRLFLQLRNERRRELEQIALDAVVGDFEDRRLGVLVDRDDGARALHADQVLNGARDAERDIQLGRDGLARAANLALHRQPAVVADRPRRGELGAKRLGELLGDRDVLLRLDAAAHRDDALGLRQIDGLLGFLERRFGLLAQLRLVDVHRRGGHAAGAMPFFAASARNAPIWIVTKCGAGPCGATSAVSLPWNIGRANVGAAAGLLRRRSRR